MKYCAGVDGGQSSTQCVIGDERGILARASGPPADLVGEKRDSPRQAAVLDAALAEALESAGLAPETPFAAIVAGISGYDEGCSPPIHLRTPSERTKILHDSEIAHAGAFDGRSGIVVIAGTGSVALGIDELGRRVRAGGWGYLLGDEGSAFWIAREAVARAMREEDSAAPGSLGPRALAFFGVDSLRALQHAVAHGEIDHSRLAAFAAVVLVAARAGDRDAAEIRQAAVNALARLGHLVHRRLGSSKRLGIAALGGVFSDGEFLDRWKWAMRALEPAAHIPKPLYEPAIGALRLAYREAALEVASLA